VAVGSALVPLPESGSEPSRLGPYSHTPTIVRLTTRTDITATTHPPQLTIRRPRIIRPQEVVGAPITIIITLASSERQRLSCH
jgi:hypothetical protein